MIPGFIILHKKLLEWGWFKNHETLAAFIYLLLKANHKDSVYMGVEIKRGEVVFGREKASFETGISEQSWRTCLQRLKSTSEIVTRSTSKFSIITICNYSDYQDNKKKINQHINQHINLESTSNQPHLNNENNITIRKYICPPEVMNESLEGNIKGSGVSNLEIQTNSDQGTRIPEGPEEPNEIANGGTDKYAAGSSGKSRNDRCPQEVPRRVLEYEEIISYMNSVFKSKYKPTSKSFGPMLHARMEEGYPVAAFKAVIDHRYKIWHDDEKMKQYLRPDTLFRPKHFEIYVEQARMDLNKKKHSEETEVVV